MDQAQLFVYAPRDWQIYIVKNLQLILPESKDMNAMMVNSLLIFLISIYFQLLSVSNASSEAFIKSNCQNGRAYERCAATGGIEYIYIYDEIDQDTARKVTDTAGLIPVNKPFPKVYLNSRGGSSIHAKQIGRTLRLRNAEVESRDV